MKTIFRLNELVPKLCDRYRSLPVIGTLLEDFVAWLQPQGYARNSIRHFLRAQCAVTRWLKRRKIGSLRCLTPELLVQADAYFRPKEPNVSGAVRALHRFLRERQAIPDPKPPVLSPSQAEADRFAAHLREERGLAESTIHTHVRRVIRFLDFLGFNRQQTRLRRLGRKQIESFVRRMARTHNRFSLLQVAVTLRSFLRFEFSRGILPGPLHDQVDMPRVYLGERLPKAVPWEQVRQLLQSIARSDADGLRDFTMLYLGAAYGLRCGELVHLRLEDLDWREATLQVRQTKTQQMLQLPLTDEAGEVLVRYLREGRPETQRRELFLHARAPAGPLKQTAVRAILNRRLQRSGLKLAPFGSHVLRHSLAVHLLRRGVSTKSIGDTLGHRDVNSTAVYLRLNVADLRSVGLPAPAPTEPAILLEQGWISRFPRLRSQTARRAPSTRHFRSAFGSTLQRYLEVRRTLGRQYAVEEQTLRAWDDSILSSGPKACPAWSLQSTEIVCA
jgi:site-specific recombinase XerD